MINGDGLILGRMASLVAKRLMGGETIDIVNSEKIVVSGKRQMIFQKEHKFLEVGGRNDSGPVHFRQPHRIVRRSIRGMIPYRKPTGKVAFSRLKVHIGIPEELETAELESMPKVHSSNLARRFVTIGDIAESIGWKKL